MLDKIIFQNGVVVKSEYLNEVQKGATISTSSPRIDYYSEPSELDHDAWPISYRDAIKDWEMSHPDIEPETNLGRLAHDAVLWGCKNCSDSSIEEIEVSFNYQPNTTRKNLDNTLLDNGQYGVIVSSGRVLDETLEVIEWPTVVVIVELNTTNYIYAYYEDDGSAIVVANTSLPSRATRYTPIARVDINSAGEITEIQDLRHGVYIDSLLNRANFLRNTDIINLNSTIESWDRAIVDTSNGEIYITMPENSVNNDMVSIVDAVGTFSNFPVHLIPNGDQKINNSNDIITINKNNSQVTLFFFEPLNTWLFADDFLSEEYKELGTFIGCGGWECIGITSPMDCPNGQQIPPVFPNPSEGTYYYEETSGKCFKKISENVSIYSDGEGGFIKLFKESRCQKSQVLTQSKKSESISLKVDLSKGDDHISNDGIISPFKTIERALLEAAYRKKDFDKISIEVSPEHYYVENRLGNSIKSISSFDDSGLYFRTYTNYNIGFVDETYIVAVVGDDSIDSTIVPRGLEIGRVIYSESGANAVIIGLKRKQICTNDCGWILDLKYINGSFEINEKLYFDDFSVLNPETGGIIVPNGVSLISKDLRKTKISPLYVPSIRSESSQTSIFKLTGNTFVMGFTFTDNVMFTESHSLLCTCEFVSEEELEFYYSEKLKSLFKNDISYHSEFNINEIGIVYPENITFLSRLSDNYENITGKIDIQSELEPINGDSAPYIQNGYIYYPGKIKFEGFIIPDVNNIRGASPYIKTCSVRSQFGLNGVLIDGSKVKGSKSMVISEFTIVTLQLDPECYVNPSVSYYNSPTDLQSPKEYKKDQKYRSYGFKVTNDGYAQIVSCFVIGASDHFYANAGGEISVSNSCSNFGDKALVSKGFKSFSYPQDFSMETDLSKNYFGTRISKIIRPKPLKLETYKIPIRLGIDVNATSSYYKSLPLSSVSYRLYIRTDDQQIPSASLMGSEGYVYTNVDSETLQVTLASGLEKSHRNYLCVDSVDYIGGRTVRTSYFVKIDETKLIYNPDLDNGSQIFKYDPNPIIDEVVVVGTYNLDGSTSTLYREDSASLPISFIEGRFFYINNDKSKVYTITSIDFENNSVFFTPELKEEFISNASITFVSNDYLGGLWYVDVIEEEYTGNLENQFILSQGLIGDRTPIVQNAPLYTYRDKDIRTDDERIFKLRLDGFSSEFGLRTPQENFVLEAPPEYNVSINSENNPLVLTNIEHIAEGEYEITLVTSDNSVIATTDEIYPAKDLNNPELTENPKESLTYQAIKVLAQYPLISLSEDDLGVSDLPIEVFYVDTSAPFNIELRKPSTIRASSHIWEWVGYLNYDSSLQNVQGSLFSEVEYVDKLLNEELGGKIYATGSTESGKFIIGNQVINLSDKNILLNPSVQSRPSESLLSSQSFPTDFSFGKLSVSDSLTLGSFSSLELNTNSNLQISSTTNILNNFGNNLSSENYNFKAYASESTAGFVQLATQAEVISGVSNIVAITPKYLEGKKADVTSFGLSKLANVNDTKDWINLGLGENPKDVITNQVFSELKSTEDSYGIGRLAKNADSLSWMISGNGNNPDDVVTNKSLEPLTQVFELNELRSLSSDIYFKVTEVENVISSRESKYIYVFGSYVSLWTGEVWKPTPIPKLISQNQFDLETIGATIPNTIYKVYAYLDDDQNLGLKCFPSAITSNETLINGVVVKENDPIYRFIGSVYVYDVNGEIYTSLNLGGSWSSNSLSVPRIYYSNFLKPKRHTITLILQDDFPVITSSMNTWDSPASSNPSFDPANIYETDPKITFLSGRNHCIDAEACLLTYHEYSIGNPNLNTEYVLTSVGLNVGAQGAVSKNVVHPLAFTGTTSNRFGTCRSMLNTQVEPGLNDLLYLFRVIIFGTHPINIQPNKNLVFSGLNYGLKLTLEA